MEGQFTWLIRRQNWKNWQSFCIIARYCFIYLACVCRTRLLRISASNSVFPGIGPGRVEEFGKETLRSTPQHQFQLTASVFTAMVESCANWKL